LFFLFSSDADWTEHLALYWLVYSTQGAKQAWRRAPLGKVERVFTSCPDAVPRRDISSVKDLPQSLRRQFSKHLAEAAHENDVTLPLEVTVGA